MKKIFLFAVGLLMTITIYAQWYSTNLQFAVNAVAFVNSTTGFVSSGYAILKTTDGGTTWASVTTAPMDSIFLALSFPSENVGYAVGLNGNLRKTSDGGNTWTRLNCGTDKDLWSVFFTDESNGYFGGEEGALFRTTDGGQTWQTLNSPVGSAYSLFFTGTNFGILAGNTRSVYRTQDGGANWLEITFDTPNKFMKIHFPDATTGYAVGMKDPLTPCMIKSTDGGLKWFEVAVTTGYGLMSVFFVDNNFGFAAGMGGTIIKTTDGGANWTLQPTPYPGLIDGIWFTDHNHGFATGPALIRTDNGGGATGIGDPTAYQPLKVAPNPATDYLIIDPGKPGLQGDLTLIDLQGRRVMHRDQARFPLQVSVGSLAPGPYFLFVESKDSRYRAKVSIGPR